MIDYLKGKLAEKTPASCVIETGGVGMEAKISLSTFDELPKIEADAHLWTRMVVREDEILLFGFATREERWLFDHLISVSGVGPKLALTILSGARPELIRETVAVGDSARLRAMRGIGAKTADRIVLELSKKFSDGLPEWSLSKSSGPASAVRQARDALISLGLTLAEADKAIEHARQQGAVEVEDLIKSALKKS